MAPYLEIQVFAGCRPSAAAGAYLDELSPKAFGRQLIEICGIVREGIHGGAARYHWDGIEGGSVRGRGREEGDAILLLIVYLMKA